MKFFRILFAFLALGALLAALAVGALFLSPVQTWIVQTALARNPDLPVTVDSVSADLSSVRVTMLRVQLGGVVLEVPSLEAKLPLLTVWRERRLTVQSLVAKGWRLDLGSTTPAKQEIPPRAAKAPASSTTSGATVEPAAGTAASRAFGVVRTLFRERKFPFEWSLDGLALEGEVLLGSPTQKEANRFPVVLQGGGLTAGHPGAFTLDARSKPADARRRQGELSTQGSLVVAMDASTRVTGITYTGNLAVGGARQPAALAIRAAVTTADGADAEHYSLQVRRDDRSLLILDAGYRPEVDRFGGKWQLHLKETDLAEIVSLATPVECTVEGDGDFLAPSSLTGVRVSGQAVAKGSRWTGLMPALDRLGAIAATATFALNIEPNFTRVERLNLSLSNDRPLVRLEALQPFQFDQRGEFALTSPTGDWLKGTVTELPLTFVAGFQEKWALTGGDVSGDFLVHLDAGELKLRTEKPFKAKGVSIGSSNRPLLKELDLSLALIAQHSSKGWQLQAAPLVLSAGGEPVATIEAKCSPLNSSGRDLVTTGNWQLDLEKLAAHCARADLLMGKSAAGKFSVSLGARSEWRTTVNLTGRAEGQSLSTSVRALVDRYGFSVELPLTITEGGKKSELLVHVAGSEGKSGFSSETEVTGVDVTLAHLEPFLEPLARASGWSWPALLRASRREGPQRVDPADLHPFWGQWVGRGKIQFYRLDLGEYELTDLAANFTASPEVIRLEQGKAFLAKKEAPPESPTRGKNRPPPRRLSTLRSKWIVDGTVAFDAKSPQPYSLGATITGGPVDSARLIPAKSSAGDSPALEGRFKVRDTITSSGRTLAELLARRQDEFRAVSAGGIFHLLKTNVAQSLPDDPTPVKDALAGVGSAVAALFGVDTKTMPIGLNKLSKPMEAVLNLTYEFPLLRYDHLALTAVSEPNGDLQITEVALVAANVRLSGSGRIPAKAGLPFYARPMSLELQLSARDRMGSLLSTAGLLSATKDDKGFAPLSQRLRFGGTLEAVDNSEWHDLLVKTASQPTPKGK